MAKVSSGMIVIAAAAVAVWVGGTTMSASAAATADNPPVPTQIVDLANKVDGVHPGYRAFHAKGVVVQGTFKASPEAARLSSATIFSGKSIPLTARFSDGSGMPTVPVRRGLNTVDFGRFENRDRSRGAA